MFSYRRMNVPMHDSKPWSLSVRRNGFSNKEVSREDFEARISVPLAQVAAINR